MANEKTRELLNQLFEDANKNGVPDLFEGGGNEQVAQSLTVNGKDYNSIEELPAEVRDQINQAFGMLGKNKWMKNIAGTVLRFMPEMDIVKSSKPANDQEQSSKGFVNIRISSKWLLAVLLVVIFFIVWWLRKETV